MVRLLTFMVACGALAAEPDPRATLLGAIDIPLTTERLSAAGLDEAYAGAALTDPARSTSERARAVAALALLGTPSARARIEATLEAEGHPEVRIQAAVSLARRFGPEDRAAVEAKLKALPPSAPEALRAAVNRELERLHALKPK